MTGETTRLEPTKVEGYDVTRFNALRHGVLSRYTVLPWEDVDEYRGLVSALVTEHAPQGLTEEHLVEELAGIVWRIVGDLVDLSGERLGARQAEDVVDAVVFAPRHRLW